MIILFDESTKSFDNLGLGVLKDATDCIVKEKLNDSFELEMNYPISGSNYSKLQIGRILFAKPNPYDNQQAFRIQSITKPLKGVVKIYASHISYDMNGIPVKAIDASGLNEVFDQIQNGSLIPNEFKFFTDISIGKSFKTTSPYNMRAILMGDKENSLIGRYEAEVKFDNFTVHLKNKRGKNRGAKVTYGFNMTDLNHQSNTDLLYNGVFPYYHTEKTSTETQSTENFTQVYIIGASPFVDGWLSYSENGEPYHPLDDIPVQIATEGKYYQKVYSWSESRQKYVEKIYNESVTLIEGVTSPTWIVIDWSKFPIVTCRANANGYYKTGTDSDWGDLKGVGDEIFSGNILREGISSITSNMIIYYSEVIPSGQESSTKEVTEVVDVQLDDPIIKINTPEANSMKYDRILSLDLTSEFNEEPTKEKLKAKADEYISKNKVGTVRHTTEVSFIDLQSTTERDKYLNFDHVELGDPVRVIYSDLGVDVELRVISTEYDVLSGKYLKVELGEKEEELSTSSIQNGDNISSLTNNVGYTDITTVNKLIAETVTAEFINAANAKLTNAQINQLAVSKISCSGIIEASQFVLDDLVAKLLVADNAKIAETLEAGNIKVAGDIKVTSGSISIKSSEADGPSFVVDNEGNVTANSVAITGGTLNINEGRFEVTQDGSLYASNAYITGGGLNINDTFIVNSDGELRASNAYITGGGLNINENFVVDTNGSVYASALSITASAMEDMDLINIGDSQFRIDQYGRVFALQMLSETLYVNNIKMSNLNIWDEEIDEVIQEQFHAIASRNNINVKQNVKYYINIPNIENCHMSIYFYDANNTQIKYATYNNADTFTISGELLNVNHIKFEMSSAYGDKYKHDICINEYDENINGQYFSYSYNDDISMASIKVDDHISINDITIKKKTGTDIETCYFDCSYEFGDHDVTFTVSSYDSDDPDNREDKAVPEDTSIQVNYSYTYKDRIINTVVNIVIKYNTNSTTKNIDLGIGAFDSLYSIYPLSKIYYIETGSPSLIPDTDMAYNFGDALYKWYNIHAVNVYTDNGVVQTSDIRCKKDISYDLSKYEKIFDALKPVSYKFINDKKEIVHLGFIAQDIKEILTDNNLTSKEFACLNDSDDLYKLNYSELHALEILEIQKLKTKVELLERQIKNLRKIIKKEK